MSLGRHLKVHVPCFSHDRWASVVCRTHSSKTAGPDLNEICAECFFYNALSDLLNGFGPLQIKLTIYRCNVLFHQCNGNRCGQKYRKVECKDVSIGCEQNEIPMSEMPCSNEPCGTYVTSEWTKVSYLMKMYF